MSILSSISSEFFYLHIGGYEGKAWPWRVKHLFNRGIKIAKIPVEQLTEKELMRAKTIVKQIQNLYEDPEVRRWGNLTELQQLESYLNALGYNYYDADRSAVLCDVLPLSVGRYAHKGHLREIHTDQILSNCLQIIGVQLMRFGEFEAASEAFMIAFWSSKPKRPAQRMLCFAAACMYSSKKEERKKLMDEVLEDFLPESIEMRTIYQCFRSKNVIAFDDMLYGIERVGKYSKLLAVMSGENYVDTLINNCLIEDADRLVNFLAETQVKESSLLQSVVSQMRAQIAFAQNKFHEVVEQAGIALRHARELLLQSCSTSARKSVWRRYDKARVLALESFVASNDPVGMAYFLEQDRMRSYVNIETDDDDDSDVSVFSNVEEMRKDKKEERSESDEKLVMSYIFSAVWSDVAQSYSMRPLNRMKIESKQAFNNERVFLSLARINSSIYWTALSDGLPLECGVLCLNKETDLLDVLDNLSLRFVESESSNDKFSDIDFYHHLTEWGTPEEIWITSTLGKLIPECVKERINDLKDQAVLTISSGSEIPPIPWPIIRLGSEISSMSLIEISKIRHWLSADLSTLDYKRVSSNTAMPLYVVVDDPDELLRTQSPVEFLQARYYFKGAHFRENSNFVDFMREHFVNHPNGVFYYRGHLLTKGESAYAHFAIPTVDESDEDVKELTAGILFDKDDDGVPLLPMPSRVIWSCCSSAAVGMIGGEAVGLAAACIEGGGAKEVVATTIDVIDCVFTSRFDGMLVEIAQECSPLFYSLSELQGKLYSDWKIYSLRGGVPESEETWPHPLIWAMYQAY